MKKQKKDKRRQSTQQLIVKFETGYYICGNTFRCIWAKSTA